MEGVGARLGRSSTRYGPATVFSGPVRRWKKRWIHVSPSNNNNNYSNSNNNHSHHQNHNSSSNGNANGNNNNNGSNLLLYKWTPLTHRDDNNSNGGNNSNNNGEKDSVKEDNTTPEEPPRRKFKYIPIAVLEEQKRAADNEAAENADIEAKPTDTDPSALVPAPRSNGVDEKPDINDVPMEEHQDNEQIVRQDLNESTLDLCLGLKAHDGDSDSKAD